MGHCHNGDVNSTRVESLMRICLRIEKEPVAAKKKVVSAG